VCVCMGGRGGNPLGALGFCLTNQTEAATALANQKSNNVRFSSKCTCFRANLVAQLSVDCYGM